MKGAGCRTHQVDQRNPRFPCPTKNKAVPRPKNKAVPRPKNQIHIDYTLMKTSDNSCIIIVLTEPCTRAVQQLAGVRRGCARGYRPRHTRIMQHASSIKHHAPCSKHNASCTTPTNHTGANPPSAINQAPSSMACYINEYIAPRLEPCLYEPGKRG